MWISLIVQRLFRSTINSPLVCILKQLKTSHSSLQNTLQTNLSVTSVWEFLYVFILDMAVEGTRNCLILKARPLGFALKMAVLSKVK